MISGSRNSNSISARWCALVCLGAVLLASSACENELRDAKTISAKDVEQSIERTTGVEALYSDSARVKARLTTPLMLHYKAANPYYEWPDGLTVVFYDDNQQEQNRVRSDYAIRKENERIVELRNNVVITTRAGDVLKSDQIFWDQNTRKFYSDKLLTRISKKGEIGYAQRFESDENFKNPLFYGASGNILLPESQAGQIP